MDYKIVLVFILLILLFALCFNCVIEEKFQSEVNNLVNNLNNNSSNKNNSKRSNFFLGRYKQCSPQAPLSRNNGSMSPLRKLTGRKEDKHNFQNNK